MLSKGVPRVRLQAMWRVPEAFLEQAQDDATVVAIRDMERAGIDIVSDGEIRRESYSNRFATALDGVDVDNPGVIRNRTGAETAVPRVVGRIVRNHPVELRDMQFLRRNTDRPAKITLPGPFTMAQQAQNDFYRDVEEMAMDFAAAVNAEAHDLQAAGADVIQLDEPWLRNDPEAAKRFAVPAINRALAGITVPTALHLCFGYAAVDPAPEAQRLLVPARARGDHRRADLHRGRAAQAGPGHPRRSLRQDDHPRRDRPRDPAVETAGPSGGADPRRAHEGATGPAHPGARLRDEIPPPRHRLRQAPSAHRRRAPGARRALLTQPRPPPRTAPAPIDRLSRSLRSRSVWKLIAPKRTSFANAHTVTGRVARRGPGDGSAEPLPARETTTQRPRSGNGSTGDRYGVGGGQRTHPPGPRLATRPPRAVGGRSRMMRATAARRPAGSPTWRARRDCGASSGRRRRR